MQVGVVVRGTEGAMHEAPINQKSHRCDGGQIFLKRFFCSSWSLFSSRDVIIGL